MGTHESERESWAIYVYYASGIATLLTYLYFGGVRWMVEHPPTAGGIFGSAGYLLESMVALVTFGTGNPWYVLVTVLAMVVYLPLWHPIVRPPMRA